MRAQRISSPLAAAPPNGSAVRRWNEGVPIVDGEFLFITARLADNDDDADADPTAAAPHGRTHTPGHSGR